MTDLISLLVVGFVVLLLVVTVIGMYNKLIRYRNRFKNAFPQIDVQLKRRYDLIPNLVETAKTYMKYDERHLKRSSPHAARLLKRSVPPLPNRTMPMRSVNWSAPKAL